MTTPHMTLHKLATCCWLLVTAVFFFCSVAQAQQAIPTAIPSPEASRQDIKKLNQQVKLLEARIDVLSARINAKSVKSNAPVNSGVNMSGISFLFGAFCALWAQSTKRNPWLWFFFGAIFSIVAVLVLLYKNSN